ncbi:hypothetical protein JCM3770_001800, partial [Rhodotorula araucariae]
MVHNPLPVNLPQEVRKATKILDSFANPHNGLDSVIPASVLRRAKGFCLLTVTKAGFLFSGRAGTGVVIARLDDGTWSAPSAVGTAGAGFGFQVGVELAEFLIILNSRAAVKSFMSAGSLTLGGNMSVAAGPLGRNVEGTGALSAKGKVAAMYSYSRTKGLFGGASVEGSIIVERSDANAKAYGYNVTVTQLLSGAVDPPQWAMPLINTISRLATPARSLPGGGWSTDSPLESPAPSTPDNIAADEEGYFSRARAQRRIEDEREDGLTPREYKERGYAFGSAFAAAGSTDGLTSPAAKDKGRIGAMLGSVGRSRSGSASGSVATSRGTATGTGFAAMPAASDDPFATGGPVSGASAHFETRFDDPFDFASAAGRHSPAVPSSSSPGVRRSRSPSPDLMAFDDAFAPPPQPPATSSRKDAFAVGASSPPPARSPEKGRSRASSSASAGASWFTKATGGGGNARPKLTKNRSSAAATSGLRERAGAMRWDDDADGAAAAARGEFTSDASSDPARARASFDSLDDEFAAAVARPPAAGLFGAPSTSTSTFTSTSSFSSRPRDRARAATLAGGETTRRAPAAEGGARGRAASSAAPGPGAYKPWDSEDESFLPPASSAPKPGAMIRSRSGTTTTASGTSAGPGAGLDLRPVEADFATVLSLSRHGGDGEVGVASGVASGIAGSGSGTGRSRSGTGASARAGNGGGIGRAVALFDFAGVEPPEFPFRKNAVITHLPMA